MPRNENNRNHYWKTLEGKVIPVCDLEDSHLQNIVIHLQKLNRSQPSPIKEEIKFRSIMNSKLGKLFNE